ncbi:MAG: ECF transporter S component [Christensenellales bacterium]
MENSHTKTLVISSMIAALIFVVTFLVAIPVPGTSAYVNMGDSVIYCAGLLLNIPWAAAAAGVGSALADWAIGFPVYIPATIIIKALMGLVCSAMMRNAKFPRFILACVTGGSIMFAGYFIYEVLFMGGWGYAVQTLIGNLIQWAGGVAGAIALYHPVKRIKGALI